MECTGRAVEARTDQDVGEEVRMFVVFVNWLGSRTKRTAFTIGTAIWKRIEKKKVFYGCLLHLFATCVRVSCLNPLAGWKWNNLLDLKKWLFLEPSKVNLFLTPKYRRQICTNYIYIYVMPAVFDMTWYDVVWYGMIWYEMMYVTIWYDIWYDIWCDMIWHDKIYDMIYDIIWYDMIRNDMIWYDMIWYDMIWYDMIWYDMIWYDMIWYDMIWYDIRYDMIWYMIWYDMIWYDMIWYDMIWYDMIWYDIW